MLALVVNYFLGSFSLSVVIIDEGKFMWEAQWIGVVQHLPACFFFYYLPLYLPTAKRLNQSDFQIHSQCQ
jgi:hypothetical protein